METDAVIRCVVVDDHQALCAGLVKYIDGEPDMEMVGQLAEASTMVELIERRRPDVAIVEPWMPRFALADVCAELAARRIATTLLLHTVSADADMVEASLASGARGVILKGGPVQDLIRAVRQVHAGQVYVDSTLVPTLLESRKGTAKSLLSRREREVLQLLADGLTTERAANRLYLSTATVRSYAESAMQKLGARNRTHAVAEAVRRALIA